MELGQSDVQRIADSAIAALQRGDGHAARAQLREATEVGAPLWYLLSQAERSVGDVAAEKDALSEHLTLEPRHLPALLRMAELGANSGDDRLAISFYRTALASATQPGARVAPDLVPLLRAGEAFIASAQERFTDHLNAVVNADGLGDGVGGARLRLGVDLLFGRAELFQQQPSMFYFPGLAQRYFFERDEFAWLPAMEAATSAIRDELCGLMEQDESFAPYVTGTPGRPRPANTLLDDPRWSASYLWQSGEVVGANADRCPAAMKALELADIPRIAGRSPTALFSLLRPGTHIQPHHGMLNTRLICHLPLIVPPDCALRVGSETRGWREGETLIFDDSIEHEAWNNSDAVRVVLLFEIWRPELSIEERAALTRIFEAIDSYTGVAIDEG